MGQHGSDNKVQENSRVNRGSKSSSIRYLVNLNVIACHNNKIAASNCCSQMSSNWKTEFNQKYVEALKETRRTTMKYINGQRILM